MKRGFPIALLLAVMLTPGLAAAQAQDASVDPVAGPVAGLEGLWRVTRAEGSSAASIPGGRLMRLSRSSIVAFTAGTCSNPGFTPSGDAKTVKLDITCLGQSFASVEWESATPDSVTWAEPGLKVTLQRVLVSGGAAPAAAGTP